MNMGQDMSIYSAGISFGDGKVIDDDVGMFNPGH